jgi:citrate lyase subunit beta/citryl-CoA lyase
MNELSMPLPVQDPSSALAAARSFLFVPANRPERFPKALASDADVVIVDLEDAVAPTDKTAARGQLAAAFCQFATTERTRLVVRMNACGTSWQDDDLKLLQQLTAQGLAGVMVPKAESVAGLRRVSLAVGPACVLLPLVESVAGLDVADALAAAPQVLRLAFGNLDFQADVGLNCDAQEAELVPVRLALVLASRRAGLAAPIDGVTTDIRDGARLQSDAMRARRGGFSGKLCIHPSQAAGVNAAFTPTPDELARAQRVQAAFEAAGGGVFSLDGRMIDAPVLLLAQRTLAQASSS